MNDLLTTLSDLLRETTWLAPLLAFVAGMLTSFMPCSLAGIPLVIGYVGGTGFNNTKRAFLLSMTFVLGNAITFTVLGVLAVLAGRLIGNFSSWWFIFLGVLMVLMALQTWGVFEFIPSSSLARFSKKTGYLGALLAGVLGGAFSSPCATPVLVALIAIVAGGANLAWGILLLFLYSLGHGVLAVIAGTSVGFVQKITSSDRYFSWSNTIKIVLGALILLIGFYMFYLGF